jgi:DNA polymerase-3 subunit alpha
MGKIPDYLDRAEELGMEHLAITDHGVMYGCIEFYKAAKKKGIKPILGCECYLSPRRLTDKDGRLDAKPFHLVLLAKSAEGYKNLMRLASIANTDGYYYKPRIDKEALRKYSKGLIALSACLGGEVARNIINVNLDGAKKAALEYKKFLTAIFI